MNSCKGCEDRHIGCHGHCGKYNNFLADYHARQDYIKQGKETDNFCFEVLKGNHYSSKNYTSHNSSKKHSSKRR